ASTRPARSGHSTSRPSPSRPLISAWAPAAPVSRSPSAAARRRALELARASTGAEAIHRGRAPRLSRAQADRGKRGLVWRVRKVLRLQAKAGTLRIAMPVLRGEGAVEEIPAVELHAGLGCQHLQPPAG